MVTNIKIAGRLYAGPGGNIENIKQRTFDLAILDKNSKSIYRHDYPYSQFPSLTSYWVDFDIPDIVINDKFYVSIYTNSPSYGLHIGADDSAINEHSDVTASV